MMASAAIAQQPDGAVASAPNIPTAKRATSHFRCSNVKSQLELTKPLTHKARRIITKETDRLIEERNKLDRTLLKEVERDQQDLKPSDWLSREDVLKWSDALARRETEHLRARNKSIKEIERLYKCDPSLERKIDLELLQALLWKFKRNLGTYLSDRERALLQSGETDSDASSDGSDCSDNEGSQDEVVCEPRADSPSSSDEADTDKDGSHKGNSARARRQSTSSLDDSFDDCSGEQSKKRRLSDGPSDLRVEKEPRKQARKEQTSNKHQPDTLGSQSLQPSPSSNSVSRDEEGDYAGDLAAIDSMFQSKAKLKVYGKKVHVKTKQPNVSETTAIGAPSGPISLAKTKAIETKAIESKGIEPKAVKAKVIEPNAIEPKVIKTKATKPKAIEPPTQSSAARNSASREQPLFEPGYKRHARAMMDPNFNDWVYNRPNRKRKRPPGDEFVHGALPDPRDVVSGDLPLPTPPASSPVPPRSPSTQTKAKKVDKSPGGAHHQNDQTQRRGTCNSYHSSGPEPSVPDSSAVGASTALFSTREAPRSPQEGRLNGVSAS